MIENMWRIDIGATSKVLPNEIVEAQCEFLKKATGGNVTAKVSEYQGNIFADEGGFGNNFTFEFFITSPYLPNYKFRVFIMQYDVGFYPLKLQLEHDITTEVLEIKGYEMRLMFAEHGEYFSCQCEEEFKRTLSDILNSQRVNMVIENINLIALREDEKMPF